MTKQAGCSSIFQGAGKRRSVIGLCGYLRPTARRIVPSLISAAWPLFFNHWATSRQIDKFDRWSGGPAVPHNSIAACLARSRSGLRVGCGVVAWVATAIKPFQKILFDDRKLRAAGRIDVLISD